MALGGGTFTVQNKVLPGAYINFVSAARASATLSDRGTAAFPLALDWGPENEVFTVESGDFQKNSLKLFGHAYTDDALRPLREIFVNAQTLHVFRLNTGGVKASCQYAEAKYPGTVGNDLKIVIAQNEAFEETENEIYDVSTYVGATQVDVQKGIKTVSGLVTNDYVTWKGEEALAVSAGIALTGGSNGEVQDAAYQTYLDKIEPYSFNVMGCDSTNDTVKALFANFTKRIRDEQGVKFQTVLHRYAKADYEGVISVENGLAGADTDPSLVYWVTGAEAACAVNKSLTNATYTGEYTPNMDYRVYLKNFHLNCNFSTEEHEEGSCYPAVILSDRSLLYLEKCTITEGDIGAWAETESGFFLADHCAISNLTGCVMFARTGTRWGVPNTAELLGTLTLTSNAYFAVIEGRVCSVGKYISYETYYNLDLATGQLSEVLCKHFNINGEEVDPLTGEPLSV